MGRVLFGTTSWADRGLVQAGTFYPRKTMTARERLAFYCSRFGVAEVATTYRFPPTPELCAQWVERTPPGFTFDIRAWSLLTGAPTLPDSLWPDLWETVDLRHRHRRRLYPTHLTGESLEECWMRFRHSLEPLVRARRLGTVICRYPGWYTPRPETWEDLALLPVRLPGVRVAVELTSPKWFAGGCEATLEWLEERGLAYVCVDGPEEGPRSVPGVVAATADVGVVRFAGRRCVEGEPWTLPYRYGREELAGWVGRIVALAEGCAEVHVLMDNCWGADAVDNALELAGLVGERLGEEARCRGLDNRTVVADHVPGSFIRGGEDVDRRDGHATLVAEKVLVEGDPGGRAVDVDALPRQYELQLLPALEEGEE